MRAVEPSATPDWARNLDAVVVGGGGLVSFDQRFRPFQLTNPSRWPARVRAAWNAVGSQNTEWHSATVAQRKRLAACCERLAYVSVRSRTTATLLARCGYTGSIAVVPDAAIGVTPPSDDQTEAILREAGAEAGEPLVGISVGNAIGQAGTSVFYDRLAEGVAALGMRAIVFPFGNIYGDAEVQQAMASRLRGCLVLREPIRPFDRWRLIGRMRTYVGCRLHAILAAYAQNVPFLAVDEYFSDEIASSKIREFCVDNDLEAHWTCPFLPTDPAAKLSRIWVRRPSFAAAVKAHRRHLDAHYDALVSALLRRGGS